MVVAVLFFILAVSVVHAQEKGYFFDLINSNANINNNLTNSSVIENIALTNGTLNINVTADNFSTLIINGINYTSQPPQQSL